MFRALSMNEIYSNGLKLYPFSGHLKVHLMAM